MGNLLEFYKTRFDFIMSLVMEHLQISFIAIVIASVLGVSLGVFIHQKKRLSPIVLGIVSFLYTIPHLFLCWGF